MIIRALGEWGLLGGNCIEKCHLFEAEIVRQAELLTGLKPEAYEGAPDHPVLSNQFSRTVYLIAVGREDILCECVVGSRTEKVILLSLFRTANLAWVSSQEEFDSVKAVHRRMVETTLRSPFLKDIRMLIEDIARVGTELSRALSNFAGKKVIAGECSQCRILLTAQPHQLSFQYEAELGRLRPAR